MLKAKLSQCYKNVKILVDNIGVEVYLHEFFSMASVEFFPVNETYFWEF